MACTHPGPVERIERDGKVGVRCPACGMTAFQGESLWRTLWDTLRFSLRGGRP